jgi:hypothetical protein
VSSGLHTGVRAAIVAVALVGATSCMSSSSRPPNCDPSDRALTLVAQSVPSAARVPCIAELPSGWYFAGMQVADGATTMWLSTGVEGSQEVTVAFSPDCDPGDAEEIVPSIDEIGAHVYQVFTGRDPIRGQRFQRFDGGCVVYTFAFPRGTPSARIREAQEAVSLISRGQIARAVEDTFGETLCGAGSPPCEGA